MSEIIPETSIKNSMTIQEEILQLKTQNKELAKRICELQDDLPKEKSKVEKRVDKKKKEEKVMVCGIPFTLKRVESDHFNANNLGTSSMVDAEIRVKDKLTKEQFDSVLIHEWIHMILDANSFGNETNNEQLVCCLQNCLYQAGFRVPIIKE